MRLVLLNDKQLGKILANTIYSKGGVIFIKAGVMLTENIIERLKQIGVITAYIEDDNTEIILEEVIESNAKINILENIKKLFQTIKKTKWIDESQVNEIRKSILNKINISENSFYINNYLNNDELSELALHTLEVIIYTIKISSYRQFLSNKIETIMTSALLHDIGKLFDNSGKPHNQIAYELIKSNTHFGSTVFIPVLHLHERVDGKGYFGINADKLYENSQILHIANNYSNFSKSALMPYEVIEYISSDALDRFDQQIFKDSINAFYSYPNGVNVVLNDGTQGIVFKQNKGFPSRPVISIGIGNNKRNIDLTQNLTTFIQKVDLSV